MCSTTRRRAVPPWCRWRLRRRRTGLTLVPITGEPDDVDRVAEAVVDGFVVWTTADDDPVVAAVAATQLPAAVHGGPGRGLPVVTIANRAVARAIGAEAFAHARRLAVLSFPLDRARERRILFDPDPRRSHVPDHTRAARGLSPRRTPSAPSVAVCERNSAAEGARMVAALMAEDKPPDAIG